MSSDEKYGCKGCSCFMADDYSDWMPNAGCRYHGLLAEYQAPRADTGVYKLMVTDAFGTPKRADTGVYKVDLGKYENGGFLMPGSGWVDSQGRDAMQGPECPPGVHSLFDPCPGGCLNDEEPDPVEHLDARLRAGIEGPNGWSMDATPHVVVTTEKERGVLATVRRWWNGLRWPYRWR